MFDRIYWLIFYYVLRVHLEIIFCPNFSRHFEDVCTRHKENEPSAGLHEMRFLAVAPAEVQVLGRPQRRPRPLHTIDHR